MAVYTLKAAQLRGAGILNSFIIPSSSTPSIDPDAQAFITAAAITNPTQQTAINSLVVSMKGYGIWTKMNAIYPFVGGTASQHKFNLKDPLDTDAAYRIVFNGGWVHNTNGITSNGTNTFADTKLIYTTLNSGHMSLYSRSNVNESGTVFDMGCTDAGKFQLLALWGGVDLFIGGFNSNNYPRNAMTDSSGLFINNRTSSSDTNLWRNGGKLTQSIINVSGIPNLSNYIGAYQLLGGQAVNFSTKNYAFSSIGDGLTDTEAANYYTAVQAFQTTLGRQV
jgi:hypothetical protein